MYVVGLSGGIGSGKTVASDHFSRLGIAVVDTDVIAREVVEPGTAPLNALVDQFGSVILQDNGRLNRAALRTIAFASSDNKAKLDSITHPAIRDETHRQIGLCSTPYCIVVVPLLTADSPFRRIMRRIVIVTAEQEIKIDRVKKRSNLTRDEIVRIMQTQLTDTERLAFADDVIENDKDIAYVHTKVEQLHYIYLKLANTTES